MHGEFIGVPDREMVCYVVLRGPFVLTNISIPPGMEMREIPIAETVVQGFDTRAGNLLIWGTGPEVYFYISSFRFSRGGTSLCSTANTAASLRRESPNFSRIWLT
jgi:hypothetical protein